MLGKLQKDVDDAGSSADSPAAKDQSLEEASSPGTSTAKVSEATGIQNILDYVYCFLIKENPESEITQARIVKGQDILFSISTSSPGNLAIFFTILGTNGNRFFFILQ